MKPEPTIPAAEAQSRKWGQSLGLLVIAIIVLSVSAWMSVRGRSALASPMRAAVPTKQSVDDVRFSSDAWYLPNDAMLGFIEVPAGVFTMGSDPAVDRAAYENERWSSSQRQGRVELNTFYIARYEVTVGQFAAFVAATQRPIDSRTLRAPANHPVTHVTWTDALAYARWLEAQMRASKQTAVAVSALLDDGWRVSLPSEAQWEKAARGTDTRIYPWGNEVNDSFANFGRAGTAPVGSFMCPPCSFGIFDMSGNVWELTRSPFQPYPWSASDQPNDTSADALFVMRGGAYNDTANNVRAAIRGGIDPGARRPFIGFRLVIEKSASSALQTNTN